MSKMTMIMFSFLAAFLFGCGGKYLPAQDSNNLGIFVETWTGTWRRTAGVARDGTMTVTLARSPDGKSLTMSGTVHDPVNGDGTVVGGIYEGQQARFAFQFQGAGSLFDGPAHIDSRGHLVGPFELNLGDFHTPTVFDLAPVTQ